MSKARLVRLLIVGFIAISVLTGALVSENSNTENTLGETHQPAGAFDSPAGEALEKLPVKGRAPKTGYERSQFGSGWENWRTCDARNRILARDLTNVTYLPETCTVASGILNDPYTGNTIEFTRGAGTSSLVQIDHVVALSDAWQKGAQQLAFDRRVEFANDDLNLLAVDGPANQQKGDGDAATWLPPNKPFRCQYVARQIAVKAKYELWVTQAEHDAMARILDTCPNQKLPATNVTE
jgi:hypothetical protein